MKIARSLFRIADEVRAASRDSSLARLAGWVLIGNATTLVCQAITVIVIARIGGPVLAGRYTLALSITAPVILLFAMQLRVIEATDTSTSLPFAAYFTVRVTSVCLALLVIAGVTAYRADSSPTTLVIVAVALCKAIESISDISRGAMQRLEKMREFGTSQALRSIGLPICISLGLLLNQSLALGCFLTVVAWLGVFATYDVPVTRRLVGLSAPTSWFQAEPHTLLRLVTLGAPLGFAALTMSLRAVVPNYLIEARLGEHALGIFGTLAYLPVAGATLIETVGQTAMPRLALYFRNDQTKYLQVLGVLSFCAASVGLIGTMVSYGLGDVILGFLFGEEYVGYSTLLTVIVLGATLTYLNSIVGVGLTAAQVFKPQASISVALVVVTLAGGIFLISNYGLIGAGVLTLVTGTAWLTMQVAMLLWTLSKSKDQASARELLQIP